MSNCAESLPSTDAPSLAGAAAESAEAASCSSRGPGSEGELSDCGSEEGGPPQGPPAEEAADAEQAAREPPPPTPPPQESASPVSSAAASPAGPRPGSGKTALCVASALRPPLPPGKARATGEEAPTAAASPVAATVAGDAQRGKKKAAGVVSFNASHSDYDAVAAAAEARGWKVVKSGEKANNCNVHWIDDGTIPDWFKKVEPWMRVNHFPGMNNALARKTRLARNMARMQRLFSKAYQFLPPTWVLPDDLHDLERRFGPDPSENKMIYIVKPDHLCQGKGIFLTTELNRLKNASMEMRQKGESAVVQRYITRPMLIEGLKFDLRLYFLVAGKLNAEGGLDLRCFLFKDGLVRLCTTAYEAPTSETMDNKCMHLTNYAVNKHSSDFQANTSAEDDGSGSKRSLRWFMRYVEEEFGEKERRKLWFKLMGLCVKTVLTVQPTLEGECNGVFPKDLSGGQMGWRCFEVLGIDVMFDTKRKPYLIEINHLPSFTTDSPLDEDIKRRLLDQTLELTCSTLTGKDRKLYEQLVRERRESGAAAAPGTGQEAAAAPAAPAAPAPPAAESAPSPLDQVSYKDFDRAYPPPEGAVKLNRECEEIFARVQELFQPVHVCRRSRGISRDTAAPVGQQTAGTSQRPPLLPKPSAGEPASGMRRSAASPIAGRTDHRRSPSPGQHRPSAPSPSPSPSGAPAGSPSAATQARTGPGAPAPQERQQRSRSAPLPQRCGLPPIARTAATTTPSPRIAPSAAAAAGRGRSQLAREGGGDKGGEGGASQRALSRKPSAPRVFLALKSAQISL